jgi:hypothetical protein
VFPGLTIEHPFAHHIPKGHAPRQHLIEGIVRIVPLSCPCGIGCACVQRRIEIGDLDARDASIVEQENLVRRERAMRHASVVRVRQPVRDLLHDLQRARQVEPTHVSQEAVHGPALHEIEDQEQRRRSPHIP